MFILHKFHKWLNIMPLETIIIERNVSIKVRVVLKKSTDDFNIAWKKMFTNNKPVVHHHIPNE